MSVIDEVLAANALYKETHDASLYSPEPRRKLAVLMCMDTRLDRHRRRSSAHRGYLTVISRRTPGCISQSSKFCSLAVGSSL